MEQQQQYNKELGEINQGYAKEMAAINQAYALQAGKQSRYTPTLEHKEPKWKMQG